MTRAEAASLKGGEQRPTSQEIRVGDLQGGTHAFDALEVPRTPFVLTRPRRTRVTETSQDRTRQECVYQSAIRSRGSSLSTEEDVATVG